MNIQQLVFFDEICRRGSFSEAAGHLFISQQGLSSAMSRLESELACTLFHRERKGVVLTEDGKYLYERVKVILAAYHDCVLHFNGSLPNQHLRIASVFGAIPEFAGAAIRRFSAEYPDVKVSIAEYPDYYCENAVESGDADIGFSIGPIDASRFDSVPLFSRPMCLIANKANPLAENGIIRLEQLRGLPMVIPNEQFKPPAEFLRFCRENGVSPNIRLRVGEIFTIHRLVSTQNDCVGLTVESVTQADSNPSICVLRNNFLKLDWTVYLIRRKGERSHLLDSFTESILSDLEKIELL